MRKNQKLSFYEAKAKVKKRTEFSSPYVIGVDTGGTKTVAAISDLRGKILIKAETGPSNPNKVGIETAVREISLAILKVTKNFKKAKIIFTYIALAGGTQRNPLIKRQIKNALKKFPELSFIFKGKVIVEGDEKAEFRAGTSEKNGILIISGTGSLSYGWNEGKEEKTLGWDYFLGDKGSGFWIGQVALQAVCRSIDNMGPKTLLTNLIFKKLKIKKEGDLIRKIYQPEAVKIIASLAPLVDKSAEKGDKVAKEILIQAAKDLAIAAIQNIKKLNLENKKFPVVLAGGVFKSKIVLDQVKREIKKFAPKVEFIRPKQEPVIGAVKLAIEQVKITS